jgi:hypothetical protein
VCISDDRAAFESAAARQTVKHAAARFGFHYRAAARHVQNHIDRPGAVPAPQAGILETFERAFGYPPMAWQRDLLSETRDTLVLKGRQVGFTACAAALAIHTARQVSGSTSAIISPSQRQSSEVTVRDRLGLWQLDERLKQDSVSLLRLANGSRIVSLPGSARGIRGYSCQLTVIDEASWVPAETHTAARPLTAATNGRLIIGSTPGAPVGPFYELATKPPDGWATFTVKSSEVPTISAEFLERERREMAPDLYAQEYEAAFGHGGGGLFTPDRIAALFEEVA